MRITRLNHVVMYVRDARRTTAFYEDVLGFRTIILDPAGAYAFLRASGSQNHHDLASFSIGPEAGAPTTPQTVGMYHVAWEVPSIAELIEARAALQAAGALVGESDHAVNKSLYAQDPDGLEFEVMYLSPASEWGDEEHQAIIRPLDLESERGARAHASGHRSEPVTTTRPRFGPVERRTLAEVIREQIQRQILDGALPAGARLPSERELCDEFNVARTSVREAIQGLITVGLVERHGNRAYVAEELPSVGSTFFNDRRGRVKELFEVRRVIELPMIELAACRATPEEREEIKSLAGDFHADLPLEEFRRLDRAFHWALARASHNASAGGGLHQGARRSVRVRGMVDDARPGQRRCDADHHRVIGKRTPANRGTRDGRRRGRVT